MEKSYNVLSLYLSFIDMVFYVWISLNVIIICNETAVSFIVLISIIRAFSKQMDYCDTFYTVHWKINSALSRGVVPY